MALHMLLSVKTIQVYASAMSV